MSNALDPLAQHHATDVPQVLFVCVPNAGRSQLRPGVAGVGDAGGRLVDLDARLRRKTA